MVSSKSTLLDALKALQSILILFILTNVCHENSAWSVEKNTEERPNILFLFADDWGRHASILSKLMELVVSMMSSKHRISTRLLVKV